MASAIIFWSKCQRPDNNIDPDAMIEMSYISRTEGRWLKDMLRTSSF